MELPPHLAAAIAFIALVPFGIYAALSGKLTGIMTVFGAMNIIIITVSLILLFGALEDGTASGHHGNGTAQ